MKNYVNEGEVLPLTAPYDVASGAGMKVGFIFAVATSAALSGASVEGVTYGVFDLLAVTADTGSVGAKVYWDDTAKKITTTVGSNLLVGVLTATKIGTDTTARVRLDGAFR